MTIAGKNGPPFPVPKDSIEGGFSPTFRPDLGQKWEIIHSHALYVQELEGAEEDGVGGGFAKFELVAGIELGGAAGLHLNTHVRGPVYHHGSIG